MYVKVTFYNVIVLILRCKGIANGIMANVGIANVTLTNTISVNDAVIALRFNMAIFDFECQ
jgi:hypothetical protein